MSNTMPGPGDRETWGPPTGHPNDPRTDNPPTADCALCRREFEPQIPNPFRVNTPTLTHCEQCAWLLRLDADELLDEIVELRDYITTLRCQVYRLGSRLRAHGENEEEMVTR